MKKVFIIHGFEGSPNGGWRSWLMGKLNTQNVYACALAMPSPKAPMCDEGVEEIRRNIERDSSDEIYLVGHSLGVPAILRYLESSEVKAVVRGAVLVSGPSEKTANRKVDSFLENPFNYALIKSRVGTFVIIHGDNDQNVPLSHAESLAKKLNGELIIIKNGGHLNGSAGWFTLPECLDALNQMF